MESPANNSKPPVFDPFEAPTPASGSKSWLWATAFQAGLTLALLAASRLADGGPREPYAQLVVLIGIVATWSLALRTIRERLLELMRCWQKASRGLLKKASESGRHMVSVKLSESQETYIKGAIWRLRIIAAGISIPFFAMPLMWSFIAVVLSLEFIPASTRDSWPTVAFFTTLSAVIVAGYLHWVMLPQLTPVRVSGQRPAFRVHRRK